MLFSNKMRWTTETCYNMDKPQKYYAKWKKLDTKEYILHESIHIWLPV